MSELDSSDFNDPDVNSTPLHQSFQIQGLLKHIENNLTDDINETTLKNIAMIDKVFRSIDTTYFKVVGNNLSKSRLIPITYQLFIKFCESRYADSIENHCFQLVLSVVWNATDVSEMFCQTLIDYKDFKTIFRKALLKINVECDNDDFDFVIMQSMPSILTNIVRRQELKHIYLNDVEISNKIMSVFNNEKSETDLKITCLNCLLNIVDENNYESLKSAYISIQENVVDYTNKCLSDDTLHYNGFSMNELLDLIVSMSKIDEVSLYFNNSSVLEETLVKLLDETRVKDDKICMIIQSVYKAEKRKYVAELYKTKSTHFISETYQRIIS